MYTDIQIESHDLVYLKMMCTTVLLNPGPIAVVLMVYTVSHVQRAGKIT